MECGKWLLVIPNEIGLAKQNQKDQAAEGAEQGKRQRVQYERKRKASDDQQDGRMSIPDD